MSLSVNGAKFWELTCGGVDITDLSINGTQIWQNSLSYNSLNSSCSVGARGVEFTVDISSTGNFIGTGYSGTTTVDLTTHLFLDTSADSLSARITYYDSNKIKGSPSIQINGSQATIKANFANSSDTSSVKFEVYDLPDTVIIPSTFNDKTVTSIKATGFKDCSKIKAVVIPDSVTSIGNNAFLYCSGLTSVYYNGTAEEWNSIYISSSNNSYLTNAARYYYDKMHSSPIANSWRYVNGMPEPWKHSYTQTVTAPTCTSQGYTTHTCSECGYSYNDNYISATGHKESDWLFDYDAWRKTCTVCYAPISTADEISVNVSITCGNIIVGMQSVPCCDSIENYPSTITADAKLIATLEVAVNSYNYMYEDHTVLKVFSAENCKARLDPQYRGIYNLIITEITGDITVYITAA